MTTPRAPAGLGPAGKRLWRDCQDFCSFEPHETRVLIEVCRVADRLDQLHKLVEKGGFLIRNQAGNIVLSPLVVEVRQQGHLLAKLMASLRIPDDDGMRPQRRGGARVPYKRRA